jgi:signal transduction histidine kinase
MRLLIADAIGSDVARRLLPAAVAGPPLLCVVSYFGYRAGLYDAGLGLAVLTTLNSAVLTTLIWRTGAALNQTDAERRRTEQQRNELNAEHKRLEEQLFQARKLESIGRLAGGVAHDFNNLLTAIYGYSELLESEIPAESELSNHVRSIQRAADRAAALTGQLLAFARRQLIQPKVVNLNELILNLDSMLQRLIGEHIKLTAHTASDLNPVCMDPNQFEQILINLVVNARDAIPPEGGRITVETRNVTLDAEYARQHDGVTEGDYVMLAVSDTGSGMDEAVRLQIFEPFFTTKEKGRGTGLGLATVYGIVKQAGGHIWMYSEVGEGTAFKIYLPRATDPVDAASVYEPAGSSPRGTETLLIAEDESELRSLATAALQALGYHVLVAVDGVAALALAVDHKGEIDLLVTDVVMPRMSGKDLAEQLRISRPSMKVLYVSGYTEETLLHHGTADPGTAFLAKPYTLSDLSHKVREVLSAV